MSSGQAATSPESASKVCCTFDGGGGTFAEGDRLLVIGDAAALASLERLLAAMADAREDAE